MRAVLVTGASTGIGRATAERLARGGWDVFAGVRREEDGAALRDAVPGGRLQPVYLDVTDQVTIEAAVEQVAEAVGGAGLAGLVNNAGVGIGGPLEHIELDELRRQLEVNVVGQVAVTQAALPLVRAAHGRIVFTGSIGGRMALPFLGPYNASKSALAALASSLRQELRPWGIPVILIEPGAIATPIWDKAKQDAAVQTAGLGDTARDQYGKTLGNLGGLIEEMASRGIEPDKVAKVIEDALTASRPPLRRVVGLDAHVQAAMARVLPVRAIESFMAWQMRRAGR